jgi:hypothetical protein
MFYAWSIAAGTVFSTEPIVFVMNAVRQSELADFLRANLFAI